MVIAPNEQCHCDESTQSQWTLKCKQWHFIEMAINCVPSLPVVIPILPPDVARCVYMSASPRLRRFSLALYFRRHVAVVSRFLLLLHIYLAEVCSGVSLLQSIRVVSACLVRTSEADIHSGSATKLDRSIHALARLH